MPSELTPKLVSKSDETLASAGASGVPAVVLAAGKKAGLRFIEFFAANIRNPNTRRAYYRACSGFFSLCETRGLSLERIGPVHAAAYVEHLQKKLSRPTVKLQLAAIPMLFDFLPVAQVVPFNPAPSVPRPMLMIR